MAARLRERPKPAIRDFIKGDATVICVEGFQPFMGQAVDRGRYFHLDAPVVRQYPMYFAVCIPVADVLVGEIERGG